MQAQFDSSILLEHLGIWTTLLNAALFIMNNQNNAFIEIFLTSSYYLKQVVIKLTIFFVKALPLTKLKNWETKDVADNL